MTSCNPFGEASITNISESSETEIKTNTTENTNLNNNVFNKTCDCPCNSQQQSSVSDTSNIQNTDGERIQDTVCLTEDCVLAASTVLSSLDRHSY